MLFSSRPFLPRWHRDLCIGLYCFFLCWMLGFGAIATNAATFVVDRADDAFATNCTAAANDCTLSGAIISANNAAGTDNIIFALPGAAPHTITLRSALPNLSTNLTLTGPGANLLTVRRTTASTAGGTPEFGIFFVDNSTVSITGLTIADGKAVSGGGGILANNCRLTIDSCILSGNSAGSGGGGGGIYIGIGTVTIQSCILSGNSAGSGGGGIYNGNGTVTINNSTLSGNSTAGDGGGIANAGAVTINNSTLSGNSTANQSGGGISNSGVLTINSSTLSGNFSEISSGGGISNVGVATINNSTLSGNSAASGGGGILSITNLSGKTTTIRNSTLSGNSANIGGGLYNNSGRSVIESSTITANIAPSTSSGVASTGDSATRTEVHNSLIAANSNTDADYTAGLTNSFRSYGYNLIGDGNATGEFVETGDQVIGNNSPGVGALGFNGGQTQTHALLAGSPAINKGDNAILNAPFNITSDQRLFTRKAGAAVDIGAFELNAIPLPRGDFNGDGFIDFLLFNSGNRKTVIWNLQGNAFLAGRFGPTLPPGWNLAAVADIDLDGGQDYLLFNSSTRQTAIWFLRGITFVSSVSGPSLPAGWTLIAAADFNQDRHPDFVLFNASTRQTAIWLLNGNLLSSAAYGPTLPAGWTVVDALEFNNNGRPDFLLFNPSTRQTAIWYLNFTALASASYSRTLPPGWTLQGAADFNSDAKPDFVLFEASTRKTAIWYLNGATFTNSAFGPTLPSGYSLASP